MFDTNIRNSLPGYTGHIPGKIEEELPQDNHGPRKQIPGIHQQYLLWLWLMSFNIGYGGYISGVKSENVFGLTYGKTSYMSSAKDFPRGIELTPDVHYTSVFKGEFVNHADYKHETTA